MVPGAPVKTGPSVSAGTLGTGHRLDREANSAKKEQMGRKEKESTELKSSSFKTVKMRM